ncbi:Uncharacterized protein dnl_09290 [Desulfonema limicola]|uniref:TIGR02646 family protein n=1 Tax=Desulfonema limicola TaxID=45656 RepID=A0A975B4Q0_9BACT|nr:hypothetical protein [Desulfonema limicola]QTA78699.1 Uncharacterized protein dnl_09290 [Desulfonema limicola]
MIRFERVPEPAEFDEQARMPGLQWLESHPSAKRPRDYWNRFKTELAEGFNNLCAYTAIHEPVGTVDHFISIDSDRSLAYEWENYRFASGWINSSKQNADNLILDPFEVENDWFEIHLPSLQMTVSENIPEEHRAKAEYTLKRLHLQNDPRVIGPRQRWYQMYQEGKLTLEGLREMAPLVARAVEKHIRNCIISKGMT